ncbi:hypothetical protein N0Y54_28755 [Nostoc punctiforme UO1]|uniref:hypothetical protein n=1 Tax=Nostoc punctiforme TaxID=272131 RepID=UPI0030B07944
MGTDVVPIGNHTIKFSDRGFHEIADEIIERLRSVRYNAYSQEINFNYQYEDEYYSFQEDTCIYIIGKDYNDQLFRIEEFKVRYCIGFRYHHWCVPSTQEAVEARNRWRMYLGQVERALGGDRVIYLADNAHHLEKFAELEIPFPEIEAELLNTYGLPCVSLEEAYEKGYAQGGYQGGYFIDYFH